jgi:cysteine-rich repeat protein
MTRGVLLGSVLAVVACTRTEVDPDATAIEVATVIDGADGITQLRLSGTIRGRSAFEPGAVPERPQRLDGKQTAVVLLPETLDGEDVLLRVDAYAGAALVHSGGAIVTVRAREVRVVDVALGAPAICGDGTVTAPESCDDANALSADGCSAECLVETGFTCDGAPSACGPTPHDLVGFAFLSIANPGLRSDVIATINGTAISATVPNGTSVASLVATFAMTGQTVRVGGVLQVSGATPNDFSSPVTYTVAGEDGSTKTYTAAIKVAPGDAKDLMSFRFLAANNPGLAMDITGAINGTAIAATVPAGTDVHALVATFNTTGVSVAVGAAPQVTGVTANDFTNPVDYTVTAADSSTNVYSVSVAVAASSSNAFTRFGFRSVDNPTLGMDVDATLDGTAITAALPAGTDPTQLIASFESTGASVRIGATLQASGATANDFTGPVTYTVVAMDSSTRSYTVRVTVAAASAKELTAFAFASANNASLPADVIATITGNAITAIVPNGTNRSALIATFATTGATATVAGVVQTSGVSANNFSTPVAYVVAAADGSTQTYLVTVTVASASDKDLTSFAFLSAHNPGLSGNCTGVITGTTIAVSVPPGTDRSVLVATFATTGRLVKVGTKKQTSGITANDFTAPVTYTVTAMDNSTKSYTVVVN